MSARMSAATAERLRVVLGEPGVVARYRAKIVTVAPYECWFWTGAIAGRGHGRFWLSADQSSGQDFAVIAHRFGFAVAYGFEAMMAAEVVAHTCDNTLCQLPGHWQATTHAHNRAQWAVRRHQVSGPLRDTRGARARAVAVRDALVSGRPLPEVFADGVRPLDRDQLPLWNG